MMSALLFQALSVAALVSEKFFFEKKIEKNLVIENIYYFCSAKQTNNNAETIG
jgi:hypothetical protein